MTTITLTDDQFSTLVNGLQTAAAKFEANAAELRAHVALEQNDAKGREVAPLGQGIINQKNGLAAIFDQQAKDTWALSYVFNGAEKVEVTSAD